MASEQKNDWGDDADRHTLAQPSGSPARLITLFATLGCVLLLVVLIRLGTRPPSDPTQEPAVGQRLTQLHLTPLEGDGEPLTIASLEGQVVLINFWGPWCPPCRAEFPELMEVREGLAKNQRFRFVSVTAMPTEDEADLVKMTKAYLKSQKYDLPVYRDSEFTTRAEFKELNKANDFPFPTTMILDQQGVVRALWIGYQQGSGEKMRDLIEQLLKESPP